MKPTIWIRERFKPWGSIKSDTALSSLPRGASEEMINAMILKLESDRAQVQAMMKEEVEALMRLGAQITKMVFFDKSTGTMRLCVTPKNVRDSFIKDGSNLNMKRFHWIFHELPLGTHQDVLPQRKNHMDLSVDKITSAMNVTWAPKKEGEIKRHKNCIEHIYAKTLNEKRQTAIKTEGTNHKRNPVIRHPKSLAEAKGARNYKRGKIMYYYRSEDDGECLVSKETQVRKHRQ